MFDPPAGRSPHAVASGPAAPAHPRGSFTGSGVGTDLNPGQCRACVTVPWSLAIVLALLALALHPWAADADAAPPPPHTWFNLVYGGPRPGALQGARLLACSSPHCAQAALVAEFGRCDQPGCSPTQMQTGSPTGSMDCAEDTCVVLGEPWQAATGGSLRLILQFEGGVRASQPFPAPPSPYGYTLQVRVTEQGLAVAQDPIQSGPEGLPTDRANFLANLLLTELVELVVAAVFLWRLKVERPARLRVLGIVALVNLLTLPVVWGFFPSLGVWRAGTAIAWLAFLPLLYAILAALIIRIERRGRRIALGVLLVVSLPVILSITLFLAMMAAEGSPLPSSAGLPWGTLVFMSEVFAVVVEAALLVFFTRRALAWRRAGLLSLAMNAASFLAGLALGHFFPTMFL